MSGSKVASWDLFKKRLRENLSSESYDAWFKHIELLVWEGRELKIAVPNRYAKHFIESHYRRELLEAAAAQDSGIEVVELLVKAKAAKARKAVESAHIGEVLAGELTLDRTEEAAPRAPARAPARNRIRLHPAYTLDQYVVGTSNRLAHAACKTVSESPGTVYSPLVLHGDAGVGKTHLLQSIGHRLQADRPELLVKWISSEAFANEYLRALQEKKIDGFRMDYRAPQVLLVDDIQFLAGKEKTQEEFLHTFDALMQTGAQVVVTCSQHPQQIEHLDDRLKARLLSGLVARIAVPDYATRRAMVAAKAAERGTRLPDELTEMVAMRVDRSVRELEGAVCKILALAASEERRADKELVLLALRELGYLKEGPLSLDEVMEAVVVRFSQDADALRSSKRHAGLVRARHLAMYIAKQLTHYSLVEIGRFFGNRDHTTVLHAVRKISRELKTDEELQNEVHALRRSLGR